MKTQLFFNFSTVVLGEHVVGVNPDCLDNGKCFPPAQTIEVESVTLHENWNRKKFTLGNDIALVRLKNPARFSYVS